jgi:hypothetical protein
VTPTREAVGNFTEEVRIAKDKRSRLHIDVIETARAARKAALDASIQKWTDMPLIAPVLEMTWAYQGEVWKTKPFTSRREKAFRREIEKEMVSRKKWLAMAQLKSVAETRHGRKLVGSPEWKQFRDSERQVESNRDIPRWRKRRSSWTAWRSRGCSGFQLLNSGRLGLWTPSRTAKQSTAS